MEKILCPTDFSEFSNQAQKYAVSLAREYKAKLILLHVIENFYPYSGFAETAFPVVEIYAEMERYVEQEMENLRTKAPTDVEIETIISRGTPFMEVINISREKAVDLIVIATHGKTGLEHVFFGSTAEKVVRKAPCPVLTIRDPKHGFVPL